MLTLTNRIDMRPGAVPLVIHLGQYDSDFTLVFELYSSAGNFTVESGTTAMIRGTKTDGHAYDADATIDVSAKTVTVAGSEQMTAANGRNVYELVLTKSGKVLSTANFILDVERAAMDADTIASESVLKELNAIIAGAETATEAATNAASAADRAEDAAESVSSASAQIATNTSDISDLKADFEQFVPGLTDEAKQALLACFRNVAWTSEQGETYYHALEVALYPTEYPALTALFSPGTHKIYNVDAIDSLKPYLTVKYRETEESPEEIIDSSDYTLSGVLNEGTNVITVSYGSAIAAFTVSDVIDFYSVSHWNSATDSVIIFSNGLVNTGTYDEKGTAKLAPYSTTHPRLTMCADRGACPFLDTDDNETIYYPIPIPSDANSIRVTLSDTHYSFSLQQKKYTEQYIFGWMADSGWQTGSFEAQVVTHETRGRANCVVIFVKKGNDQPIIGERPTIDLQFM